MEFERLGRFFGDKNFVGDIFAKTGQAAGGEFVGKKGGVEVLRQAFEKDANARFFAFNQAFFVDIRVYAFDLRMPFLQGGERGVGEVDVGGGVVERIGLNLQVAAKAEHLLGDTLLKAHQHAGG